MQLKHFDWAAQDSARPWKNGSKQDWNGPWPQSASSLFVTQWKEDVIKDDNGGQISIVVNIAGSGERLLLINSVTLVRLVT